MIVVNNKNRINQKYLLSTEDSKCIRWFTVGLEEFAFNQSHKSLLSTEDSLI